MYFSTTYRVMAPLALILFAGCVAKGRPDELPGAPSATLRSPPVVAIPGPSGVAAVSMTNPGTIELPGNKTIGMTVIVRSTYDTCIDGNDNGDPSECPTPPPGEASYHVDDVYVHKVKITVPGYPAWEAEQETPSPSTPIQIDQGHYVDGTQPPPEPLGNSANFTTGPGIQQVTIDVKDRNLYEKDPPDHEFNNSPRLWKKVTATSTTIHVEGHPVGDPFITSIPPETPNIDLDANDVTITFTWDP